MIHHRVRSLIQVLRGFLILATLLLYLSAPEAGAYVPPPVPAPCDVEGDGDDFYCRLQSEPADPDAVPVAGEEPCGMPVQPSDRVGARIWDAPEIQRDYLFWARVARWAGYFPVMRGF